MNKHGFTLVELMVAVACSAILALAVWNSFSLFHGTSLRLASGYGRMFDCMVDDIRNATKNARGLGGRFENRF